MQITDVFYFIFEKTNNILSHNRYLFITQQNGIIKPSHYFKYASLGVLTTKRSLKNCKKYKEYTSSYKKTCKNKLQNKPY